MKTFWLATTGLVVAASAAQAVDVKLYGQVNKALVGFDDGVNTDMLITDNAICSTRFGMKGTQKLDNGLTSSILLEGEIPSNPSTAFTQNTGTTQSSTPLSSSPVNSFAERQANVGLSGTWGGVYLGQLSTAIDGVLKQDLGGAQDVLTSEYRKIGGGLKFQKSDGTGLSSFNINNLSDLLTTNRTEAVRYDSPVWSGLQGKASFAQGGDVDAALFYTGAWGDFKTAAAAGVYIENDQANTLANRPGIHWETSASIAHKSGLALTGAFSAIDYGNETAGAQDANNWYVKASYSWSAYELAADYGQQDHFQSATASSNGLSAWGVAGQYNMGNGVSLAMMYRGFSADVTGTPTKDIDMYVTNLRVKF